ncbi:hypothetical protein Tcan_00932, partial [Toxocara canis]
KTASGSINFRCLLNRYLQLLFRLKLSSNGSTFSVAELEQVAHWLVRKYMHRYLFITDVYEPSSTPWNLQELFAIYRATLLTLPCLAKTLLFYAYARCNIE